MLAIRCCVRFLISAARGKHEPDDGPARDRYGSRNVVGGGGGGSVMMVVVGGGWRLSVSGWWQVVGGWVGGGVVVVGAVNTTSLRISIRRSPRTRISHSLVDPETAPGYIQT